jgi:hypothetical protein
VIDAALYGANAKVSNLINMLPRRATTRWFYRTAILRWAPKWLSQVTAALARPAWGSSPAFITGEPAKDGHKLWSSLAAMSTS